MYIRISIVIVIKINREFSTFLGRVFEALSRLRVHNQFVLNLINMVCDEFINYKNVVIVGIVKIKIRL